MQGFGRRPRSAGEVTASRPSTPPAEASPHGKWVLKNRTAKRIALQGKAGPEQPPALIIPPFGQRVLTAPEIERYDYESWTRQLLVRKESATPAVRSGRDSLVDACPAVASGALYVVLAFATLWFTRGRHQVFAMLGGVAAAITVGCWLAAWLVTKNSGETASRLLRSLQIFGVVLLGAGLPVTIIVSLDQYYWDTARRDVFGFGVTLLYILLSTASILPAALYFWFHRQKMPVVREGFLRDIVRLDPNVQTVDDADTSYSGLIDDVYGSDPTASGRARAGRTSGVGWGGLPILIATLLFAALWNWTLLSAVEHREDNVINARMSAATAAGLTDYRVTDGPPPVPGYKEAPPNNLDVLTPDRDLVSFAFLGSYFFALNMLFRRYTRSDLGPKAYTHVCVRIVTALVMAWAVSQIPFLRTGSGGPNAPMLVLAFFIGIVPETGTAVIQDFLRSSSKLGRSVPSVREKHPLADLDGISLYDRSQLLEVGIENIESLAHTNLVELMLWTRIPTSRLVDFVDQAVLYLHVRGPAALVAGTRLDENDDGALQVLSAHGIRTATDLERAYKLSRHRRSDARFLHLLDAPSAPVHRLQVVLDALEDDEWMVYLRNWRNQSMLGEPVASVEEFVDEAGRDIGATMYPDADDTDDANLGGGPAADRHPIEQGGGAPAASVQAAGPTANGNGAEPAARRARRARRAPPLAPGPQPVAQAPPGDE
jgi:hypothetical protein